MRDRTPSVVFCPRRTLNRRGTGARFVTPACAEAAMTRMVASAVLVESMLKVSELKVGTGGRPRGGCQLCSLDEFL